jgi:hypothetical protein
LQPACTAIPILCKNIVIRFREYPHEVYSNLSINFKTGTMKRTLLFKKVSFTGLLFLTMLISGAVFGQTVINNNQVVAASDITNPNVTINAGGTLLMDVAKSFANINANGNGTSTIAGLGAVTVTNTVTVASGNTLSVAPALTTVNLVTGSLGSATLAGTGQISAGTITINANAFSTGTLNMAAGLTVQAGNIEDGSGFISGYALGVSGHLKITGSISGSVGVNANNNSTLEFNGGNQAIPNIDYHHLILSGSGTKTFAGDRTITGNFELTSGVTLTLGNQDLTVNVNGTRSVTINGTLNINGNGRLSESQGGTKTLILGPTGRLNLTAVVSGSGSLGLPVFNAYDFSPSSIVEYGANESQTIADVPAPGYGSLVIDGSGTKTAPSALDIQGDITLADATFSAGNFDHQLKGNWFRNGGAFTAGTNTRIIFSGAATQTIGGTQATSFRHITFNNTAGGITLAQPTTITGAATFTNGVVTSTATNVLIFADGATSSLLASNASTTSYVNGPVRKVGNDAFVFPIGASKGFVPLAISAPDNTGDALTAQYFRGIPTDNQDITAAGIVRLSECDYWTITETADAGFGQTSVNVTLYWNANNPCGGALSYVTSPAAIKAVRYSGTTWNTAGVGVGSGTPAAGQVIFANVTAFNQFALGSTSIEENPLPVVFGDVKAYEKNNGVQVEWSNLTEKDVALYTIERSSNGRDFSAIGTQLPSSNQDDKASYVGFDAAPNSGANYYRIKAAETTGKIVYSKILTVNTGKSEAGFRLYPNPVSGHQVTVSLSNIKQGAYNVRVVNATGQDIFRKAINAQGSGLTQTLDLPTTIKAGVYNLVITGDNYRATKTFIVQ